MVYGDIVLLLKSLIRRFALLELLLEPCLLLGFCLAQQQQQHIHERYIESAHGQQR